MNKLSFHIFFILALLFCNTSTAIDKKYIDSLKGVIDTAKQEKDRMWCLYSLTYEHGYFNPTRGLVYGNILQREAEATNTPKYKFYAYNAKANCFEAMMNYDSTLYYTTLSYELYRDSSNSKNKHVALANLASIHKKMGHYYLALQLTVRADSIVKSLPNRNPRAYAFTCELFLRMNNIKKARESINIGIEEYWKTIDKTQLDYFDGILNSYLGLTMSREGKHDSAIITLKRALSILKKETDTVALSEATLFLGEAYFKNKNYDLSASQYRLAASYYENLKNALYQNFYLIHELRSKIYANNYDNSVLAKELEKVITALTITPSSYEIRLDLYSLLSDCYEKLGDYKLALKYSRLFDDLRKEVLDSENLLQYLEYQRSYENLNRENKIQQLNQLNLNNSLKLENKNLQLNRYIIIVISLLLLFLLSLFLFIQITKKNKALMQAKSDLQIKEANEKERIRISREMHDDIGAGLTQIVLMSDYLKTTSNSREANNIADTSRKIVANMSEIIWSLNTEYKSLNDLFSYLREQLHKLLEYTSFDYSINFTDIDKDVILSSSQKRNIFLAVKEAVNNAVKYSEASSLIINSTYQNSLLVITIIDNGKGFDVHSVEKGNGLRNIKRRMEEMGAMVEFISKLNIGTTIKLTVPTYSTT